MNNENVLTSCTSPTVDSELNQEIMRLEQLLESDFETQEELKVKIPFLAEALYESKDWFKLLQRHGSDLFKLLQRYGSEGPRLNIKVDSRLNIKVDSISESAAIFSVLLLFWDVPPHVKEAAARVLTSSSFGTSEAPNVSNQESVEALVLRVLCCNGGATVEVQRQVCLAICFLACRYGMYYAPAVRFGAGIQYRLLELIRTSCYRSELTSPLIGAIANIAMYYKGMRMKILETQLSHSWLGTLMDMCTKHDVSILKDACLAVACIASAARRKKGFVCEKLWDDIKVHFVPAIVNKCCGYINQHLVYAAILAISKITKYVAKSPEKIGDLVSGGCLKALFHDFGCSQEWILSCSTVGIKIILRAGDVDDQGRRRRLTKHNEYAKMIDDFDTGWDLLLADDESHGYNNIIKATSYCLSIVLSCCGIRIQGGGCHTYIQKKKTGIWMRMSMRMMMMMMRRRRRMMMRMNLRMSCQEMKKILTPSLASDDEMSGDEND